MGAVPGSRACGGVSVPKCPVDAILPDTDEQAESWLALNHEYSAKWPNIVAKGQAPPDADDYQDVPGKFVHYFSPNPGQAP